MAIFRKVHTSFWSDSFISDLDRDKKLFYLYLLTNERTTQCGIYEITKKQMAFDLGYSIDTVSKLLEYFVKCGKIKYNDNTKEIAIKNWCVYNKSTSPLVQSCVNKELKLVKDTLLIQYIYSIDTQSQEEEEQEEEQKQEQEEEQQEEEEKPKAKKFSPPTQSEVISYFLEKGYTQEAACKAFDYYDVADWADSNGKKIKNWKQKMIAVWFKEENKAGYRNPNQPPKRVTPDPPPFVSCIKSPEDLIY